MIEAVCPQCQAVFQLGDEFGGVTVQCSVCNTEFVVAGDAAATATPETIAVTCPGCRTTHQVPSGARGAEAECMVCQISFRIPETGDQGIAVGPLPPPAPSPMAAAPSAMPSPFAAAATQASGAAPGGMASSGGIDYKNTSTIKLTRSSLFGATGKPGSASPASPASPPPPVHLPAPVAPVPAPESLAPEVQPPPATPPAANQATASGRIGGGKRFTTGARPSTSTGKVAGGSTQASQAPAVAAGMGTMVSSAPAAEHFSAPDVGGETKGGATGLDLALALIPVILAPACVFLPLDKGLCAGIGGGVGLLCWLGILFHSMSMRNK